MIYHQQLKFHFNYSEIDIRFTCLLYHPHFVTKKVKKEDEKLIKMFFFSYRGSKIQTLRKGAGRGWHSSICEKEPQGE